MAGVQQFAPPTVLAQASRLNFSTRLFNLIVTNVPGPQFPLYVLGRRLRDLFPIAFLPKDHALAIAIMSYDGNIDFGLLGDYDAMPDLDEFGLLVEEALAELVEASGARNGSGGGSETAASKGNGSAAAPARKAPAKKKPAAKKPAPRKRAPAS
jgi:hypothetical protein